MVLLYDKVVRDIIVPVYKSDTMWNWWFNKHCKFLKGILVLFKEEQLYIRDTGKFCNPKIEKVSVTVEGKSNKIYVQGMRPFEQYDEIRKYFAEGKQRDASASEVQKHLRLHDLGMGEYLKDKYASWIDFRTIDENILHGTGRKVGSKGGRITLQIENKAESTYIYLIMDAQLNIQNGVFVSVIYY